ncbi:MAG: sensor histidine kinase [Ilumatobacter sp.]|uniref:sensor histidine kinase n=1 Tax=Ilumatobacter sp. TaxID=1967498 RepID=UPI00391C0CFD
MSSGGRIATVERAADAWAPPQMRDRHEPTPSQPSLAAPGAPPVTAPPVAPPPSALAPTSSVFTSGPAATIPPPPAPAPHPRDASIEAPAAEPPQATPASPDSPRRAAGRPARWALGYLGVVAVVVAVGGVVVGVSSALGSTSIAERLGSIVGSPAGWIAVQMLAVLAVASVWMLRRRGKVGAQAAAEVDGAVEAVADIDITDEQVSRARQLELIGELAAGVAHEINTPVQFLSDNGTFLDESFLALVAGIDELVGIAAEYDPAAVERCLDRVDMEFIREEVPGALEQGREGLNRISEIVRAMKDFSHPGTSMTFVDLNVAIRSTSTLCRNEWRYVANLDLQLEPSLPLVRCNSGQLKQVVLSLMVNAAQAISDRTTNGQLGTIVVNSQMVDGLVRLSVSDTGIGMSPQTQRRAFDNGFTTKEPGRGTGQGLALVKKIVDAHDGDIRVQSVLGVGTTFTVDLPIDGPAGVDDPGSAQAGGAS